LSPEIDYTAALLSHASDPRDVTLGVEADGATIATEPSESLQADAPKTAEPAPIKVVAEAAPAAEVKSAPVLEVGPDLLDEAPAALVEREPEAQDEAAADKEILPATDPALAPFPKEEAVAANQSDQSQPVPANDGALALAPFAPEAELADDLSSPGGVTIAQPAALEPAAPSRALTWVILAIGAILMAGGLWFAHLMGALTSDPKPVSLDALMAIVTACLGFVAVVTSAVSLARGQESGDETALLP
jgi:hypothetical protein